MNPEETVQEANLNAEVVEPEVTEEVEEITPETEETAEETTEEVATVSEEEKESEPSEETGPKKVDASTRVQQAVNEKNEAKDALEQTRRELDELKEKFEATQAEKPNFIDIDHDKINKHLSDLEAQIEDARLNGNIYQANLLESEKLGVIQDVKDNEKRKTEYEERQQAQANQKQTVESRIRELDNAAEFYRKELDIPSETWDQMGQLFAVELQKDKVLGKKFADMVDRQGAVATIEWAYGYTKEKLIKEDTAPRKEQAKEKLAAVTGSGKETQKMPKNWNELMKKSSKEILNFKETHPEHYKKIHNKHLAA